MVGKPFSIQAPEEIAKEYGGNKQRIAQAVQTGLLDPTSAVLAGMFIDRMRGAQAEEARPVQTVAQQVMAPPAPMAPPGVGGPGMAPPAGGLGALAPGMAAGGYARGDLTNLPIPDTMFDEPSNGGFDDGYAGGGIVAFADGGIDETDDEKDVGVLDIKNIPEVQAYFQLLQKQLSPEARAQRRQENRGAALAQLGFGMAASKSPYFLQALGESASAAMPAIAKAAEAQRTEEQDALKSAASLAIQQAKATRVKPQAAYIPMTADEKKAFGLNPDAPYVKNTLTNKPELPEMPKVQETWTVLSPEASAARGLPVGGTYSESKTTGEIKRIAEPPVSPKERREQTLQADAEAKLPGAESSVETAKRQIDELLAHPGFEAAVGMPDPRKGGFYFANLFGPAKDWQTRFDQLKRTAFLEAYQMLRGGGPISNVEGEKAESALLRASTATSEKDFRAAMEDFRTQLDTGLEKIKKVASGEAFEKKPSSSTPSTPATKAHTDMPELEMYREEQKRRAAQTNR